MNYWYSSTSWAQLCRVRRTPFQLEDKDMYALTYMRVRIHIWRKLDLEGSALPFSTQRPQWNIYYV